MDPMTPAATGLLTFSPTGTTRRIVEHVAKGLGQPRLGSDGGGLCSIKFGVGGGKSIGIPALTLHPVKGWLEAAAKIRRNNSG